MKLQLTSADYCPDELQPQLPITLNVIRQIPGQDRPDYFIAESEPPILWKDEAENRMIKYVVICARYVGAVITQDIKEVAIGLAYVTDESLLHDKFFKFDKARYSAIGLVSDIGTAS